MNNVKQKQKRINIYYIKIYKKQVVRPLLNLNRVEIIRLCIFWKLPIFTDSTNQYLILKRNRLRHQIFPILKLFFNPKIEKTLSQFIEIINSDNNYFKYHVLETQKFLETKHFSLKCLNKSFDLNWILYLPLSLQQRFFKELLSFYFQSISFIEIDFLLKNISEFK